MVFWCSMIPCLATDHNYFRNGGLSSLVVHHLKALANLMKNSVSNFPKTQRQTTWCHDFHKNVACAFLRLTDSLRSELSNILSTFWTLFRWKLILQLPRRPENLCSWHHLINLRELLHPFHLRLPALLCCWRKSLYTALDFGSIVTCFEACQLINNFP